MKFGIVITTYPRPDGKTPEYILRAVESIKSQIYQDYILCIVVDDWPGIRDLNIESEKIKIINLPMSLERGKYPFGDYRLWCCGGVTPLNTGIDYLLLHDIEYIAHLDHDDYWEPDHLLNFSGAVLKFDPVFICSLSTYYGSWLPFIDKDEQFKSYVPGPGHSITSASCVKYSVIESRFRDVCEATGQPYPADADYWKRLAVEMDNKNYKGIIYSKVTVHHDEEGYMMKEGRQ